MNTTLRAQARRAALLPPEEPREGPESEPLEHADLERRVPHPKSARRTAATPPVRDDRVGRH